MAEPASESQNEADLPMASVLSAVGLFYLGLGVIFGVVVVAGDVQSSLFPTSWLFPAILIITGSLMARRRRFDIVGALWAGLAMAVFMLDVLVHVNALDLRFDDPAAFDASIIVVAFGLVALVFRPQFRT